MNNEEVKLTEYLHNIIENNMSLRNENDRLWKQKLEYIDRISKARKIIKDVIHIWETKPSEIATLDLKELDEILGGKE